MTAFSPLQHPKNTPGAQLLTQQLNLAGIAVNGLRPGSELHRAEKRDHKSEVRHFCRVQLLRASQSCSTIDPHQAAAVWFWVELLEVQARESELRQDHRVNLLHAVPHSSSMAPVGFHSLLHQQLKRVHMRGSQRCCKSRQGVGARRAVARRAAGAPGQQETWGSAPGHSVAFLCFLRPPIVRQSPHRRGFASSLAKGSGQQTEEDNLATSRGIGDRAEPQLSACVRPHVMKGGGRPAAPMPSAIFIGHFHRPFSWRW